MVIRKRNTYWFITMTGVLSAIALEASATASTTCENLSFFRYRRRSSARTIPARSSTIALIVFISVPASQLRLTHPHLAHAFMLKPFRHRLFTVKYDAVRSNACAADSSYVTTVAFLPLTPNRHAYFSRRHMPVITQPPRPFSASLGAGRSCMIFLKSYASATHHTPTTPCSWLSRTTTSAPSDSRRRNSALYSPLGSGKGKALTRPSRY